MNTSPEMNMMEKEILWQRELLRLLIEVFGSFVGVPLEAVDETINSALAKMARVVDADRINVMEYNYEKGICRNTHEWCGEGVEPFIHELQNIPMGDRTAALSHHIKGKAFCIPDVASMPEGAHKQSLMRQNIKSLISIPMMSGGECKGFVGFDAVYNTRSYSEDEQQLLRGFAQALLNLQQRRAAEEALLEKQAQVEYLSLHDQLTGLYNRRFLDAEIKRLDVPRNLPLAMVMLDVNGLKLTNDAFGHAIGDEVLLRVATVMKQECRADDIIARVGGDEFVILLPKTSTEHAALIAKRITDAASQEKVESLNLSVSFGIAAKEGETENLSSVLRRAEDNLYRRKLSESASMRNNTLRVIMNTLYEKNKREQEHSQRVSALCAAFSASLGMSDQDIGEMRAAGLMHDIGKITIDDHVLNKAEPLNEEEWRIAKRHPEVGYRMLSSVNAYAPLAEYVLAHHERWDGTGYPKGLAGEEIPLEARIIALADAYDAMTTNRPYRAALSNAEAIEEIRHNAGKQFDPHLVPMFLGLVSALNSTALFD